MKKSIKLKKKYKIKEILIKMMMSLINKKNQFMNNTTKNLR